MLEVLGIIYLSNYTAKCAVQRGRKPGGFRALTVVFWLAFEILFMILGFVVFRDSTYGVYLFALFGAGLGALLSVLIAKNCRRGSYVQLHSAALPGAEALPAPCTVTIVRKPGFAGSAVAFTVILNGQAVGEVHNNKKRNRVQTWTNLAQNVVVLRDFYGNEQKPMYFAVQPGTAVTLVCKAAQFLPQECTGVQILDAAHVQQVASTFLQAAAQQYPAQPYPAQQAPLPQIPMQQAPVQQFAPVGAQVAQQPFGDVPAGPRGPE